MNQGKGLKAIRLGKVVVLLANIRGVAGAPTDGPDWQTLQASRVN
jgi:hypothetical protein